LAKGPGTLRAQLAALESDKAQRVLADMLATAQRRAVDDTHQPAARIDAIRLLALGDFEQSSPILSPLISNQQPHAVQSAALNTLGKFADPSIAATLIESWASLSPRIRAEATEAIFSRAEWLLALLAAAEEEKLSLADLDPARLRTLEKHSNAKVRERAAPLLSKIKLGRRQDVVAAYRDALQAKGDPSRGRQVFQKTCAACHRLEGVGHEIGPSLASFRNRGAEALLINVLDPNREVNPQFVNYVLVTSNGRSITGIVASETATSVTLRRAEDVTDTVSREDIELLRASGLSIMPEGLEKEINPAQMADLLAYLLHAL
jgi:putative heme-binding domain-containing protein